MIVLNKKIQLLAVILFASIQSFAQVETDTLEKGKKVIVVMKNGDEYHGEIKKVTNEEILLKTGSKEVSIQKSKVEKIHLDSTTSKYPFENVNDTRYYFFGNSAITLDQWKGYYQNIYGLLNFGYIGITDNITLGAGSEIFSTIGGIPIWVFAPKVGTKIAKNMHVGCGITMGGFHNQGCGGYGYGAFTYGNSKSNISFTAGQAFYIQHEKQLNFHPMPVFSLSGMHRIGKNFALVAENQTIPKSIFDIDNIEDIEAKGNTILGIYGIRFFGKKHALDIGFLTSPSKISIVLPWVSYVFNF